MNFLKQKAEAIAPNPPSMSTKTKIFIQKICYKKTASVDMTTHGFINDKKLNPVNLLLKPLREQLEKIWGKNTETALTGKKSHLRKRVYKVPDPKPFRKTVHIKEDNLSRHTGKEKAPRKRQRKIKASLTTKKVRG